MNGCCRTQFLVRALWRKQRLDECSALRLIKVQSFVFFNDLFGRHINKCYHEIGHRSACKRSGSFDQLFLLGRNSRFQPR